MPLSRRTTRAAHLFIKLDVFLIRRDYEGVFGLLEFAMPRALSVLRQLPDEKGGWIKEACYYLAMPFLLLGAIWDGLMGRPFGDD